MISEKFLNIVTAQSWGAYYFEDLTAIRQGRIKTSERYSTRTNHNRFPYVRTPAPSLSIGIVTQDLKGHKRVSWGDCVPVSFSGKSGRVQAMPQEELELFLQEAVLPWLLAPSRVHSPASWLKNDRELASEFAQSPPYVRYGLSQALLRAAALARGIPLWQVFQEDFAQTLGTAIIPLQGSCGGDWDDTVDRMLARQIPFLPQGQFEDLPQQLGTDGASLLEWIRKFKLKVERFGYAPTLTLDFHGALDDVFHRDIKLIAGYVKTLADAAHPLPLHIESPLAADSFTEFRDRVHILRTLLQGLPMGTSIPVRIVADEWANSKSDIEVLADEKIVDGVHLKMPDTGTLSECVDVVRYLKTKSIFCLLGGSCTETLFSAEVSTHLASVVRPDALLVKPGMGFDEAFSFMHLIMARNFEESNPCLGIKKVGAG